MTSATAGNAKVGNIWGDLLCMAAQLSFALYLSLFKPLVGKYSLFTINKWMFTWGIGHDPAFLRLSCGFHPMG